MIQRRSMFLMTVVVALMIGLGIIALYSTSAFAKDSRGDQFFFLRRQVYWLMLGGMACVVAACTDHGIWRRFWWVLFASSALLLALCYVPGIGLKINGSRRWIDIGLMPFQPSELAKLGAVVFLAWWYAHFEKETGEFLKGLFYPGLILALPLALIAFEVDLGTTALIGAAGLLVMFVAGVRWRFVVPLVAILPVLIIAFALFLPERLDRLTAFLHPEDFKEASGLQQYQAKIAFGSGGIEGLGLGLGRQKMHYVPYAHTDFIFPMIGEELGLPATLSVVFGYLIILVCGLSVAASARDRFGVLLATGITSLLILQAAMNIGVTTSLLPNKGLPLPFISYGGSNLVLCLLGLGILWNIHRFAPAKPAPSPEARLHVRTLPRRL